MKKFVGKKQTCSRFAFSRFEKNNCLFLVLGACALQAQTNPNYQLLTTADGLSQGFEYDILQCWNGFIWIATRDGLNRYDGARFRVFSPDLFDPFAIGGSEILRIFEDSRGWIWITLPDGLDVLDPVSLRFFHITLEGKPLVTGSNWSNLVETPDGNIWMTDGGVWKLSVQKDMLEKALKAGNANLKLPCQSIPLPSDRPVQALENRMPVPALENQRIQSRRPQP